MGCMIGYWWLLDEIKIVFIKVDESLVDVIMCFEIYVDDIKFIE